MFKKMILVAAAIVMLASCTPKPTVVKGTIKGYTEGPNLFLVAMNKDFTTDTLSVNPDSTFYFEKVIKDAYDGFICVQTQGSAKVVFIPGETYTFDVDLTQNPPKWDFECKYPDANEFITYFREDFLGPQEPAENFKEHVAFWEAKEKEAYAKCDSLKNSYARKLFKEKIDVNSRYSKFKYVYGLRKNGLPLDSDPDFNEYFNSINLSDPVVCKSMFASMLNVKADLYNDTIPYALRYLQAIDELAPDKETRDSVAAKYLSRIFLDCDIHSEYEGQSFLAKAAEIGTDEETMAGYQKVYEKAMSLMPGADAIDFEMIAPDGKVVKLSDYRGKAVYIDFWATWCLPCCFQIPYMEKLAEKYRNDKRIVFISASLDHDLDNWREKLAEDKPFWPQFCFNDAGKAVQRAYGFAAIPRFMLFTADGKIANVDAPRPQSADEISALIDSILK